MHRNKKIHTPSTLPATVKIVHISGQTDGITAYFRQSTITFGRNPACDIVFPPDLLFVSRLHAMISRYGNQYILKNLSPNGCYVNGIKKEECKIKPGDIISFADGGPVVAFTLRITSKNSRFPHEYRNLIRHEKHRRSYNVQNNASAEPPTLLTPASTDFTFQYGTTIKSFHLIKVIVGKGPCCDFVIPHPQVDEKQFQVYFKENKYSLFDLSVTNTTLINDDNFIGEIQLEPGDIITLNIDGVQLEYLGEGRISEYNPQKYKSASVSEDFTKESPSQTTRECNTNANKH